MIIIPVEPPVTEYLHNKAARLKLPLNGTFELTPLCNMDCKMCYIKTTKEDQEKQGRLRTAKEWLEIAQKMKDAGLVYLLLTGGEPFLHPEFKELFQGLHKMGFILSINSNGTLIDESIVEWLKETPPVRINMTIYGASDETYKRLCGNPKGFTQFKKAVHLLKEAGISIKLNCSVTPYNVEDLDAMFAFSREEQLLIQATSYMFPPMRRDLSMIGNNNRFSPEEAAYQSARIEMLTNGKERFIKKVEDNDFEVPSLEECLDCTDKEGEGIRCRAGKCSFWVTWKGELLPCGMMSNQSVGNVFEIDFIEGWNELTKAVSEIRLPVQCKECVLKEKCKACAAMVLTETGSYNQVPEYRCLMTKACKCANEKVYKEITEGVAYEIK